MGIQIDISDRDIPALREFYSQKLAQAKSEVLSIEKMLLQLDSKVDKGIVDIMKGDVKVEESSIESHESISREATNYHSEWTWFRKIKFVLIGNEFTTRQIVEDILQFEPERRSDRSRIVGTISAILSSKAKGENPTFIKRKNEKEDFVYSLNKRASKIEAQNSEVDKD